MLTKRVQSALHGLFTIKAQVSVAKSLSVRIREQVGGNIRCVRFHMKSWDPDERARYAPGGKHLVCFFVLDRCHPPILGDKGAASKSFI